jgi:hypothetical protein
MAEIALRVVFPVALIVIFFGATALWAMLTNDTWLTDFSMLDQVLIAFGVLTVAERAWSKLKAEIARRAALKPSTGEKV